MNQIVECPEPGCEMAAEVVSRWVWPSTDGPLEHVKVFCLQKVVYAVGQHSLPESAGSVNPSASRPYPYLTYHSR